MIVKPTRVRREVEHVLDPGAAPAISARPRPARRSS